MSTNQKALDDKARDEQLERDGPVLLQKIRDEGREKVTLTSDEILSLRCACTTHDWLTWQKAAMSIKGATAKIDNTVIFQATN